ncbi:MAG: hypothetical protein R2862_08060 [Thermoanaerobaculia bacterium]
MATILPYSGAAAEAAKIVALGGGSLVTSCYADDGKWLSEFVGRSAAPGPDLPRLRGVEGFGSGAALPQSLHGGPGRAGGEELGGIAGLRLYQQRVALQGTREVVEALIG